MQYYYNISEFIFFLTNSIKYLSHFKTVFESTFKKIGQSTTVSIYVWIAYLQLANFSCHSLKIYSSYQSNVIPFEVPRYQQNAKSNRVILL